MVVGMWLGQTRVIFIHNTDNSYSNVRNESRPTLVATNIGKSEFETILHNKIQHFWEIVIAVMYRKYVKPKDSDINRTQNLHN